MLDDLKYIHSKDADDALGIAAKQWQQLETVYDLPELNFEVENIVFAGMGGSALWALLSLTWPGYNLPFEIWRRYDGPTYITGKTLMVVSSYSGNTEEALSALEAAEQAGAHIVIAASGGKLAEIAEKKGYPIAKLPEASQPRFGVLNGVKAIVTILERAGFVNVERAEQILHETAGFLKAEIANWLPDVPTSRNPAKKLALEVAGTSPVIYAGPKMYPAAYKWKISFNENAKNVAWCNEIPEFSHNEFLGWTSHPVEKPYSVIDLRSGFEHGRVQKRFTVTERLLSGKRPAEPTEEEDQPEDYVNETELAKVEPTNAVAIDTDKLASVKQQALGHLEPLVGHLDQSPEDEFKTTMMMIQANDNHTLIEKALEAAKKITDDNARAQAMLDIINEVNYFSHQASNEE